MLCDDDDDKVYHASHSIAFLHLCDPVTLIFDPFDLILIDGRRLVMCHVPSLVILISAVSVLGAYRAD